MLCSLLFIDCILQNQITILLLDMNLYKMWFWLFNIGIGKSANKKYNFHNNQWSTIRTELIAIVGMTYIGYVIFQNAMNFENKFELKVVSLILLGAYTVISSIILYTNMFSINWKTHTSFWSWKQSELVYK